MKKILLIIFIINLIGFGIGFYFNTIADKTSIGNIVIGLSVLWFSFILMPIFLYIRWKGKKLSDYTLTPEKLKEMRENQEL